MGSLARAMTALLLGLAAASLAARPSLAEGGDAYYPTTAPNSGPQWERPKFTQFTALRCSSGAAVIDQLALNRDDVAQEAGVATFTDVSRDKGLQQRAGGWALKGDELTMSGSGFVLEGRWTGAFLTATITRPGGGEPVRCRFQVQALRSFTQYQ